VSLIFYVYCGEDEMGQIMRESILIKLHEGRECLLIMIVSKMREKSWVSSDKGGIEGG
jgi:hypothetical protein